MPKSDTWPGGVAMEPLINMDSAGSCDSVVSVNSGFSEDSLEDLSAEERACLMFLEKTIDSLEVEVEEDDSGLSNDEPDPGQLAAKVADLSPATGGTETDDVPSFQHDESGREGSFLSCGVPTPLLLANAIASLPPRAMGVAELQAPPEVATDSTEPKDEPSAPHQAAEPLTSEEAGDSEAPEPTMDNKDLGSHQPEALKTSSHPASESAPDSETLSSAAQTVILDSATGVTGGDTEPETVPALPDPPRVASEIDVVLIPPPSDFSDEPQPEPKEEKALPTPEGPTTRGPLTYSELENLRKEASSALVAVDPPPKTPIEVPIGTNAHKTPVEVPIGTNAPKTPVEVPISTNAPKTPVEVPIGTNAHKTPVEVPIGTNAPKTPVEVPISTNAPKTPVEVPIGTNAPKTPVEVPIGTNAPKTPVEVPISTNAPKTPVEVPIGTNASKTPVEVPIGTNAPKTPVEVPIGTNAPAPPPEALPSPLPEASEPRSPPAVAPKPKRLPPNIILKSHRASVAGSDGKSGHHSVPSISDRALLDPQRIRREALRKLGLLKSDEGDPGPALSPKLSPQSRRSWAGPSPPRSPAAPTTPTQPSIPAPAPVFSPAPVPIFIPVTVPISVPTLTPATTPPPPSTTVTSATSQDPAVLPVPTAFSDDPVDPLPSHAELSPVKELSEPSVSVKAQSDTPPHTPPFLLKHLTQPTVKSATLERSGMGLSGYMAGRESAEASRGASVSDGSSGQLRNARPRPASLGSGKDFASVQGESSKDPDTRKSLPAASGPKPTGDSQKLPRSHGISVLICPRSTNAEDRREALKKLGLLRD